MSEAGDAENAMTALLEASYASAMRADVPSAEPSRTVGHFPVYFPEELAHAAGIRSATILGGGMTVEAKLADAVVGSFICSICRSTVELGLSGALSRISRFYVPPICDAAKHLVGIWSRHFPEQKSEQLALPQNIELPAAVDFLTAEYRRILTQLTALADRAVSDDSIRSSIHLYNQNRQLIRELYRIRRDEPARLSAAETYLLLRAGTHLDVREHNALIAHALDLIPRREASLLDKPRVVLAGAFCEQPPLEMIETIEDACFIVDDDLLIGRRWFATDVALSGDPVRALAEAYTSQSVPCAVQHDSRKPAAVALLETLRRMNADGAVITAAKFCEPGLDDQVAFSKVLSNAGVPYLVLEFEEKMSSFEQMSMQVETFAETLLFA